jgi:hypothetical protein
VKAAKKPSQSSIVASLSAKGQLVREMDQANLALLFSQLKKPSGPAPFIPNNNFNLDHLFAVEPL